MYIHCQNIHLEQQSFICYNIITDYFTCFKMYNFKIFILYSKEKNMKKILKPFSEIGKMQIAFYKFGSSLVILVLSGIYYLCEADANKGSVGLELYYAPMLDYILTTYLIFWAGTLLLDLLSRERKANSRI